MKRKIIDVGCGICKYEGSFGIDINPKCMPDMIHDCNDGLPLKSNSVDFINCDNSLEHFKNSYYVLLECYRVLKKGGEMRLIVPNCQYFPLIIVNAFIDLSKFWYWYMTLPFKKERGVHYALFTKHLICLLVGEAGFEIKSVEGRLYGKNISLLVKKVHAGGT